MHTILFPVETAARELVYKTVLACRFADLGYECFIGSKHEIYGLFSKVSPFVYFDKGYHPGVSNSLYDGIKKAGGIIVNLDEEGGVDFKHAKTIASRYPEVLFDYCDIIFLWGSAQYNLLKSMRDHFTKSKVVVSGHPRFELLNQDYRPLYSEAVDGLHRKYGRYLLINTNMGFGNNLKGASFVKSNYGGRIANIDDIIQFDEMKVQYILAFIKALAPRTEFGIVLRPHPEESHAIYLQELSRYSKVRVVYENSVIPWILGSDEIVHTDCTTAIEAVLLGKHPISLLPSHHIELTTHLPVSVSLKFDDPAALAAFISDPQRSDRHPAPDATLIDPFFATSQNSTDMIVEAVHDHLSSMQSGKVDLRPFGFSPFRRVLKTAADWMAGIVHRPQYRFEQTKLRGLNQKELKSCTRSIAALFKLKIDCIEYNRRLFRISAEARGADNEGNTAPDKASRDADEN